MVLDSLVVRENARSDVDNFKQKFWCGKLLIGEKKKIYCENRCASAVLFKAIALRGSGQ